MPEYVTRERERVRATDAMLDHFGPMSRNVRETISFVTLWSRTYPADSSLCSMVIDLLRGKTTNKEDL